MYKNLVDVAKQIVEIANERELKQEHGFFKIAVMDKKDYDDSKKLTEILMKLEYDEVMALQAIMYLGRDQDYNSKLTKDEIFQNQKKYIETCGKAAKEIEVQQMIQKIPLGRYITDGYKILGIEL